MKSGGDSRAALSGLALVLVSGLLAFAPALGWAQDLPACSLPEIKPALDRWRAIRSSATGASAGDQNRFLVPTATASDDCNGLVDFTPGQSGRMDDGIHAWIYASRCKEIVCGVPRDLEKNFNALLAGENDFNNNIQIPPSPSPKLTVVPGGRAEALLDRQECFEDLSQLGADLALDGGSLCFEKPDGGWVVHAEITPPAGNLRKMFKEIWLPKERHAEWAKLLKPSPEAGGKGEMCVYGPLAGDTGHGLKLETHPAQLLWWNRNKSAPGAFAADGPYDMLLVQDASARFQKEHHFVVREDFPKNPAWRPWAQAPLEGHFEVPFWIAEGPALARLPETKDSESCDKGLEATFVIEPWAACKPQQGDGLSQTPRQTCKRELVSATGPALYVENHAASNEPNGFSTQAQWLCRCDGESCGGKQGYLGSLTIDAAVGVPRDFEEGALALTVRDKRLGEAPSQLACRTAGEDKVIEDRSKTEPPVGMEPLLQRVQAQHNQMRKGALAADRQLTSGGAESAPEARVEAQIRRVLDDERGKRREAEAEETKTQQRQTATDALVKTLLDAAKWPGSRTAPKVAKLSRPRKITLENRNRLTGFSDEDLDNLKIEETWDVKVCDVASGDCQEVVKGKRGSRVQVSVPETGPPVELKATVHVTLKDKRRNAQGATLEVQGRLWADRLVLQEEGLDKWVRDAKRVCPSAELPGALDNLLNDALARQELSVTTLALLARIDQINCETPARKRRSKS